MTPAYASVLLDSKCAEMRLDWEHEHMEFGLFPPDEVCLANARCLQTRWGGGGGLHAYAGGTQSRSTFFDTWTVTARGSKIQAESRGNICDSAS